MYVYSVQHNMNNFDKFKQWQQNLSSNLTGLVIYTSAWTVCLDCIDIYNTAAHFEWMHWFDGVDVLFYSVDGSPLQSQLHFNQPFFIKTTEDGGNVSTSTCIGMIIDICVYSVNIYCVVVRCVSNYYQNISQSKCCLQYRFFDVFEGSF